MTLTEANGGLTRTAFVEALGWIFEHSPWVAERAWDQRPFASVSALHAVMLGVVRDAAPEDQLSLLRAHPDLGSRVPMSAASVAEQSGAGIDRLDSEEFQRLQNLNTAYREKFGFPFLFAVRGSTQRDILRALTERLESTPAREFEQALWETGRIAWFRLSDTFPEE